MTDVTLNFISAASGFVVTFSQKNLICETVASVKPGDVLLSFMPSFPPSFHPSAGSLTLSCVTLKKKAKQDNPFLFSHVLIPKKTLSTSFAGCHTVIQADQSAHCCCCRLLIFLLIVSCSPPAPRSRWRATCCPTLQSVQWQSLAPQKPSSSVSSRSAWSCWRSSICRTGQTDVWFLLRPHTYAGRTSFFWSDSCFFWHNLQLLGKQIYV